MPEAIDNNPIDAEDIQSIPDVNSIQYKKKRDSPQVLDAHTAIMSMISAEGMQESRFTGKKKTPEPTIGKHWDRNIIIYK